MIASTCRLPALGVLVIALLAVGCSGGDIPNEAAASAPALHPPAAGIQGFVDRPASEATVATEVEISGWAVAPTGVRSVVLRTPDGGDIAAAQGDPRPDVASVIKAKGADRSGFHARVHTGNATTMRVPFDVIATAQDGTVKHLGRRSLLPPTAFAQWEREDGVKPGASPFHFLIASSGISSRVAAEVKAVYHGYDSRTQRVGIAVPILYLRTTRGRDADWVFDPDFDVTQRCGDRLLADDALNAVIRTAIEAKLPVQFILNGGIWADATCHAPQWDLNDHLEDDVANCQWTQDDRVYPDDHLRNLPGSLASPELARSLTLNVHNAAIRKYKRRNLQAAARIIASFARTHPDLFVGVNLDSDVYVNPFHDEREWFDYNPQTLRQFREWLQGTGPYAGTAREGVPDLRSWRRPRPLTLDAVNRLARRSWKQWSEVEPPRQFPGSKHSPLASGQVTIFDDPWYWEWDRFRKHLVALHYSELAQWAHEAGIPAARIFTAQGFVSPAEGLRPFAIGVTSQGQNYDSGGVSVEGAIPRTGHLGAILYGAAAGNRARMEHRHGLFATFARMDPGWAVVEMNNADLTHSPAPAPYEQAYRTFRDLANYDARQVALMAWNGTNGIHAGEPGYVAYTSWRNTPAEEAMRDHMVLRANLPPGARLWTFGTAQHRDDDGWTAERASLRPGRAHMTVQTGASRFQLLSPADLVVRARNAARAVIRTDATRLEHVEVWAERAPGTGWRRLGTWRRSRELAGVEVSLAWPADWGAGDIAERLRLDVRTTSPGELRVERIALLP